MPVEEVGTLLRRWREAGGAIDRARVLADGMRHLRGLTPDERRLLAHALGQEGLPDLAARLEDRSGRALDATQLHEITDRLLSLERDDLDHLATRLTDPRARLELLDQTVRDGLDRAPPPPPPRPRPGLHGPTPHDPTVAEGRDALAHGDVPLGEPELGEIALGHTDLGHTDVGEVDLHDVGVHEVTLPGTPSAARTGPAAPSDEPHRPPDEPHRPPDEPHRPSDEALDVAVAVPEGGGGTDGVPALLDELRRTTTAAGRFRAVDGAALDRLDDDHGLRVLDAVPAGWQRRRVARRLLDAGALGTVPAADLLARFPDRADATFVAGHLVDTGQVTADELRGTLPARVAARLAARQER